MSQLYSAILRSSLAIVLVFSLRATAEEHQGKHSQSPVDFARDIAPIFSQNCIACHNAKTQEGGLNLESHASLMIGGDSGDAVAPKNLEESYLLARVSGAEELMPPEDNEVGAQKLSESQLDLLRRWIELGAPDSAAPTSPVLHWKRIPEHLQPIYGLDTSADGLYLAFGRGNHVEMSRQQGAQHPTAAQSLVDANLKLPDGTSFDAAHLDIVQSIAFSPDSQLLATGGYRSVKLWRRQTTARQLLAGLTEANEVVAISPSGTYIAYATGKSGLEVVDIRSGEAHRFLKTHSAPVRAMVWLSDSRLLSSDHSGAFVLTNAQNNRAAPIAVEGDAIIVKQIVPLGDRVFGISAEGKGFELTAAADGHNTFKSLEDADRRFVARWLNLHADQEITAMTARNQPTPSLVLAFASGMVTIVDPDAISPSESNRGGEAKVSGPKDSQLRQEFQVDCVVKALSVSPDGALIATVPVEGPVELWTSAGGELHAKLDKDYVETQRLRMAHRDTARQQARIERLTAQLSEIQKASAAEVEAQKKVEQARDEAAKAVASRKTELEAARAEVAETEKSLVEAQAAAAQAMKRVEELNKALESKKKGVIESDKKISEAEMELRNRDEVLAAAIASVQRAAEKIPVMDARIADEQEQLKMRQSAVQDLENNSGAPIVTACVFSDDSSTTMLACHDRTVRIYATTDGQPIANLSGAAKDLLAVGRSNQNLMGLTEDGSVLAWDLTLPWTLERWIGTAEQSPLSDRITALDFSPNGSLLAVGGGPPSRSGEVKIFNVASGEVAMDLSEAHGDTVLGVRFSPDGRWLASGGADKLCRLFEVESGEMLRAFEGHTHHVLAVAWQDSGEQLATAGADNTVKIWQVATGEQQRTITGFNKEATAIEFVGQSHQFITAAADSSVHLYDADNGKQIRRYSGTEDALFTVSASADGKQIFSGGQAGKVWIWQLENAKLLQAVTPPAS